MQIACHVARGMSGSDILVILEIVYLFSEHVWILNVANYTYHITVNVGKLYIYL